MRVSVGHGISPVSLRKKATHASPRHETSGGWHMARFTSERIDGAKSSVQRARRVLLGLFVLWSLSMFDLALTIAMMRGSGMIELNPLARAIVQLDGSTSTLASWKILSTLLSSVILFSLRGTWTAEIGTWICVATLGFTALAWVRYLGCEEVQLLSAAAMSEPPEAWVWVSR
jgi:hypothetical protein